MIIVTVLLAFMAALGLGAIIKILKTFLGGLIDMIAGGLKVMVLLITIALVMNFVSKLM